MNSREDWIDAKISLENAVKALGFPRELGEVLARNLGSPRAMERMKAYLNYVKPKKIELVVDEMLAICSEINAWKEKKESKAAQEAYTDFLNSDLHPDEDEDY